MKRFALVKNGQVVEIISKSDTAAAEFKPKMVGGLPMWRPYTPWPDPVFDPTTEKLVDDIYTITDTAVLGGMKKAAMTQQEIDDWQENLDLGVLKEAGRDLAVVLIELVDQLIAQATIQVTDFTPAVKQNYLDIKAIADRVK